MKKIIFTGSAVAIVTPMNQDTSVNYPKLAELIDWQIANKTDCIVICGTTGESSTLKEQEHADVVKFAIDHVAGRVPVVAGAGGNDTDTAIWLSKEAEAAGADGLLHVTPYYNKTSQKGLVRHFTEIADAVSIPIILYNVPSRTGMDIKPETYKELSAHPNIAATKEANGNIVTMAKTRHLCGDDLTLYSGNDDQIVPVLSLGGKGVISVLSNIMPLQVHQICELYFQGKVDEAATLQIDLMDIMESIFLDVNPIPIKEAMNLMGLQAGPCRLPLVEMGDAAKDHMIAAMKRHRLL